MARAEVELDFLLECSHLRLETLLGVLAMGMLPAAGNWSLLAHPGSLAGSLGQLQSSISVGMSNPLQAPGVSN